MPWRTRPNGATTCRRGRGSRVGGPCSQRAYRLSCSATLVATLTARFVNEIEGTEVRVLDTRKTTPGLRVLEKAAVAAGGGTGANGIGGPIVYCVGA
jgi:hypothetical protein